MTRARIALSLVFGLVSAAWIPALAQSVISTHSGTVYFFDGSVYIEDHRLEQKFGRFPDIGEGRELRTEHGQAEVLLTPGICLRVGENSAIRMLSSKFSDTRIELIGGSAILEAGEPEADTSVRLIHKNWQILVPHEGVFRIDSEPPGVTVYKGEAKVSAKGDPEMTPVRQGQTLPLAAVLVPEEAPTVARDQLKNWAMSRSQAISSDNATAAGIVDDPSVIENSLGDSSVGSLGALSYFPPTGFSSAALANPYGLSFWSPYQSTLSSVYFPPYIYGALYPAGWPIVIRQSPWRTPGNGMLWRTPGNVTREPFSGGLRSGGIVTPRPPYNPPFRTAPRPTAPAAPHAAAPHGVGHSVGRR
jgi:hypothetical protein